MSKRILIVEDEESLKRTVYRVSFSFFVLVFLKPLTGDIQRSIAFLAANHY